MMPSATRSQPDYALEEDLVSYFARCLRRQQTPWGNGLRLVFEFDYSTGRPDVIALRSNGEVLAFEAKLYRWREALHQAYRNRCFANRSYVVLPGAMASYAAQYEHEFRRRRVGLCSVSAKGGIEVLLETELLTPLQPWLTMRAIAQIVSPKKKDLKRCQPTQSCLP
jgi:hypothetical protein